MVKAGQALSDGFRVSGIVLLPIDVRLNIGRRCLEFLRDG
jgi:hypothetical protein